MPAIVSSAPAKIILFGEHAVVYSQPAIAVPVNTLRAKAVVTPDLEAGAGTVHIFAPGIDLDAKLDDLPQEHPLALAIRLVFSYLGITDPPAIRIRISSSIPIAAGMGSGAAVAVAVIRATAGFFNQKIPVKRVSELAYEVEVVHHGTPSGIDNTVIAYEKPIYYQRGRPMQVLQVALPFSVVIGDSGVISPTVKAVGDVRNAWTEQPGLYEALFEQVGEIVQLARGVIESGEPARLGALMDENHALLQQIGVSSPELDHLVEIARQAGALGAKLSGAGRGGNMIALVTPENAQDVAHALMENGAARVVHTEIRQPGTGDDSLEG